MFLKGVIESAALPEAGGTTNTGCVASRATVSATEPKRKRSKPVRSLRSQHDQVGPTRVRMQQNHAGRIAVLNADFEANACRLRGVAQ